MRSARLGSGCGVALLGGCGFSTLLVVVALYLTFWPQTKPSPPGTYVRVLPHRKKRAEAEKEALRELAAMLRIRPSERQYVIEYAYDGRAFGGVVEKTVAYYRESRQFEDVFDSVRQANVRMSGVSLDDLRRASSASASMAELKQRLTRRKRSAHPP